MYVSLWAILLWWFLLFYVLVWKMRAVCALKQPDVNLTYHVLSHIPMGKKLTCRLVLRAYLTTVSIDSGELRNEGPRIDSIKSGIQTTYLVE